MKGTLIKRVLLIENREYVLSEVTSLAFVISDVTKLTGNGNS